MPVRYPSRNAQQAKRERGREGERDVSWGWGSRSHELMHARHGTDETAQRDEQ